MMLMKSTVLTVLAVLLFGCGGSDPIINNKKKDNPAPEPKPTVTRSYCGVVKNVGSVSGVKVTAYQGSKILGTQVTDENGSYCFSATSAPTQISIDTLGGLDMSIGRFYTSCDSRKQVFDSVSECVPIELNPDSPINVEKAALFRSYLGHAYENMGIAFDDYDSKILEALKNATNINDLIMTLKSVKGLNSAQKEIIKYISRIVDDSNEDTITVAMLTLDIVTQLDDGELENGDFNVTKWISENSGIVQEYLSQYPSDTLGALDIRSLALAIVINSDKDPSIQDITTLSALKEMIPFKTVAKCIPYTYIECGLKTELLTFKGDYDKTGLELTDVRSVRTSVAKVYDSEVIKEFKLWENYLHFTSAGLNKNINDQFDLIEKQASSLFRFSFTPHINMTGLVNKKFLGVIVFNFVDKDEYLAMAFELNASVPSADNIILSMSKDSDVVLSYKVAGDSVIVSTRNEDENRFIATDGTIEIDPIKYLKRALDKAGNSDEVDEIKDLFVRHSSNKSGKPGVLVKYFSLIDLSNNKVFMKNSASFKPSDFNLDKNIAYKKVLKDAGSSIKAISVRSCFVD